MTEPVVILIPPSAVAEWVATGGPQAGVHVMERVGGPTVPLVEWLRTEEAKT